MVGNIWLSNQILDWDGHSGGGTVISKSLWMRSYEIWNHAKDLIYEGSTEYMLGDGIINLKRSLDRRLKLIEDIYSFRSIDQKYKNFGYLELLEQYDIVRPFLMKNLMQIRNDIEHNDVHPPHLDRCKELVDAVWYFLKSTDTLVSLERNDFEFNLYDNDGNDTHYGYSVTLDFKNKSDIKIHGWFPNELIYTKKKDNALYIELERMDTYEEWKNIPYHNNKLISDIWIIGTAKLDLSVKTIFLKHVFSQID